MHNNATGLLPPPASRFTAWEPGSELRQQDSSIKFRNHKNK